MDSAFSDSKSSVKQSAATELTILRQHDSESFHSFSRRFKSLSTKANNILTAAELWMKLNTSFQDELKRNRTLPLHEFVALSRQTEDTWNLSAQLSAHNNASMDKDSGSNRFTNTASSLNNKD